MSVSRDEIFDLLITFIMEEIPWAKKKKLDKSIDIVNDLGLYGDDCIEFLEKFCQKFNINHSKVDFSKCGQEGVDSVTGMLLWILSIFKQKDIKQKNGYKISELIKLIESNEKYFKTMQ